MHAAKYIYGFSLSEDCEIISEMISEFKILV